MIVNMEDNWRAEHAAESHMVTKDMVLQFAGLLRDHEKSLATIDKYTRDVRTFLAWLGSAYTLDGETDVTLAVDKEKVRRFKQYLQDHYMLSSANSMLSALNTFFKYMGWQDCMVMIFKTQRATFRNTEKDLSIREYQDLIRTAEDRTGRGKAGGRQLALIMETLAGTGIRVSELPFITVASLAATAPPSPSKARPAPSLSTVPSAESFDSTAGKRASRTGASSSPAAADPSTAAASCAG